MANREPKSLFRRLTRLFRSGPVVKRKIRALDTTLAVADKTKSSGTLLFQKSISPTYATITSNAYNLSERLMRYQDFQEMEYTPEIAAALDIYADETCAQDEKGRVLHVYSDNEKIRELLEDLFYNILNVEFNMRSWSRNLPVRKDTPIPLLDGRNITIEQLAREHEEGKENWVYSVQDGTHRMVPGKVSWCGLTRKDSELVRVWLDDGTYVDCTPDHRFKLRDGSSKEAQHLVHDESLMPFYRKKSSRADGATMDGCEEVYDANTGRYVYTHHCVSETFEGGTLKRMQADDARRNKAAANIDIKFDQRCVDMLVKRLEAQEKYVSPKVLGNQLKDDEAFMGHFRAINGGTKYNLTKALNSYSGFENLLRKAGISSYTQLVRHRLTSVASTPRLQRAEKKSNLKMTGAVTAMRENHPSAKPVYKNHRVDRVEKLEQTSDVYCMEVLGPNGEHDRHNFSVLGCKEDKSWSIDSGICIENCKYGDFFLYNDVHPEYGVVNAFPIPVNEIEREENYDRDDPMAVRYRWVTLGNRTLENWEVTHFRLLGNDMFLPYGSSIIEPARRIWRQLILIEDAMLVYRVVRAPERRVFYVDVANVPAPDVPNYMEQQRQNLRTTQVTDRATGRVDLRYNPISVEEDFFIPVRGGDSGTKIDTLAGGQNTAAVEDVAYIQKKLFAALKIPRAYLGYDEMLSSKATLAQEDIRFSRTINVIQKTMLAELNKLAIIHLYAHGFDNDDLQNFTLRLSNPSTVAQQQKLELWRAKFEIAGSAPEGMGSKEFIRHEIWGLNEEQIKQIDDQRLKEKKIDALIESAGTEGAEGGEAGGDDLFGGAGGSGETLPGDTGGAETGGEEPPPENAGEEPEEEKEPALELITGSDDLDDDESFSLKLHNLQDKPAVNVSSQLDRAMYNRGRRRTHGASKTHMPDFRKMTSTDNHAMDDPYDNDWIKSVISNPFAESAKPTGVKPGRLPLDVTSALRQMSKVLTIVRPGENLLSEGKDVQDEINAGNNDMFDIDLVENESATDEQLNENELLAKVEEPDDVDE